MNCCKISEKGETTVQFEGQEGMNCSVWVRAANLSIINPQTFDSQAVVYF